MPHEMPSEYELDMFERRAEADAEAINQSLDTTGAEGELKFCQGCPLLDGHNPSEVADAEEHVGWSAGSYGNGFNGAIVNMRLKFKDGTTSEDMILGAFSGNMFTGKMIDAARANAVQKTQECEKPRKFPPFLGPVAVKSCRALQKYRDPMGNW